MSNPAVMTAICQCSFGAAPVPLIVTSQTTVVSGVFPVATIMDIPKLPMTFGMCRSMSNPTVSAATASAGGVLTPMPCIPACTLPWSPGSKSVIIGGKPALNKSSKCACSYGGQITIKSTPATTVQIP
ncbi:MAG: DUF4280 domain-containing protein [Ruminococcaceae bacterium]|nr:DUF4280 domain-containing protein [Oscillospiraceae bacterium]